MLTRFFSARTPPTPPARATFASGILSIGIGLAALVAVSSACDTFSPPPEGALGDEGRVYFQPEIEAVLTVRMMVGSVFSMKAEEANDEDRSKVAAGYFVSTNSDVIEVIEGGTLGGTFRVSGPGTASIEVHSDAGERIDAITLSGDEAALLELLDAKLVGASVDARLPERFAIAEGNDSPFFVAAESACGDALLALGGFTASFEDGTLATFERSEEDGDLTYFLRPQALGHTAFTLENESGATIDYELEVVATDDVDVVTNAPAASESPTVEFWGRAFASGTEVIGLDYNWSSPNGRVTVSRAQGPNVIASVTFPAEGEPEDTRPAQIQAEVYGVTDVVDIFGLQTADLVGQRVEPRESNSSAGGFDPAGCNGDSSTQTCGAMALGGIWFWRRKKRRSAEAAFSESS